MTVNDNGIHQPGEDASRARPHTSSARATQIRQRLAVLNDRFRSSYLDYFQRLQERTLDEQEVPAIVSDVTAELEDLRLRYQAGQVTEAGLAYGRTQIRDLLQRLIDGCELTTQTRRTIDRLVVDQGPTTCQPRPWHDRPHRRRRTRASPRRTRTNNLITHGHKPLLTKAQSVSIPLPTIPAKRRTSTTTSGRLAARKESSNSAAVPSSCCRTWQQSPTISSMSTARTRCLTSFKTRQCAGDSSDRAAYSSSMTTNV